MANLYEDLYTFMVIYCSKLFRMRKFQTDDDTAHVYCMLDDKATDTLRIFNNY